MRGVLSTINLDDTVCLGKQQSDLLELIASRNPEVILVQEARNTNLRKILPNAYGTNQVMDSEDQRNVAVIWRKATFDEVGSDLRVGTESKTLTRYISRTTLSNKSDGRKTRFVSLKMPPREDGQVIMATRLIELYESTKVDNYIMGGDFQQNISDDPYKIAKKTKLIARYYRKSGFYLPSSLSPSAVTSGPRINSDQVPASITLDI